MHVRRYTCQRNGCVCLCVCQHAGLHTFRYEYESECKALHADPGAYSSKPAQAPWTCGHVCKESPPHRLSTNDPYRRGRLSSALGRCQTAHGPSGAKAIAPISKVWHCAPAHMWYKGPSSVAAKLWQQGHASASLRHEHPPTHAPWPAGLHEGESSQLKRPGTPQNTVQPTPFHGLHILRLYPSDAVPHPHTVHYVRRRWDTM